MIFFELKELIDIKPVGGVYIKSRGVAVFIVMGIAATLASVFNSIGTSTAPSTPAIITSGSSGFLEPLFNILKGIVIIILVCVFGALGGSIGVFLKKGVKKLMSN